MDTEHAATIAASREMGRLRNLRYRARQLEKRKAARSFPKPLPMLPVCYSGGVQAL